MANPKQALIVVDVQNDFCPGGALAVAHGDEVVEPLNQVIDEFLERGAPVYKSRDWHPPKTKHFAIHGGTWPVHCVQNTKGAEFHPALRDDPRIKVISKGLGDTDCYSAFDETDLASQLHDQAIEEVIVGGLATDYCVKNTVLDALRHGFKVKALRNAMRAVAVTTNARQCFYRIESHGTRGVLPQGIRELHRCPLIRYDERSRELLRV